MYSYGEDILNLHKMLKAFVRSKTIEISQLSKMDSLIKQSDEDQIRVLNSHLPLDIQRIMFGAIRNINTSVKSMKKKLKTASTRHENPTTAEQALELIDSISSVAQYIDPFRMEGKIIADPSEIAKLSRILYRKAKAFGFSENQQSQLREAGITKADVASFVSSFDNNITQELGIEEEVRSPVENSS